MIEKAKDEIFPGIQVNEIIMKDNADKRPHSDDEEGAPAKSPRGEN